MSSKVSKVSYADIIKKYCIVSIPCIDDIIDTSEDSYNCDNNTVSSIEFDDNFEDKESINSDIIYSEIILPKGRKYQKDGFRLENAFYKNLPKTLFNKIILNYNPLNERGNIIIEFDRIFVSDSMKRVISFEIKGINKNTIDEDRQINLINQCIRQRNYLSKKYSDYKIDCIYCFVTGVVKIESEEWSSIDKNKYGIDNEFIKSIKSNGFLYSFGETPKKCAKNAVKILNLLK